MNKIIIGAILVLLVMVGVWHLTSSQEGVVKWGGADDVAMVKVERSDLGLSFQYPEETPFQQIEGGLQVGDMTMQGAFLIGSTTNDTPKISVFIFEDTPVVRDEFDVAAGIESATPDTSTEDENTTREEALRTWAVANDALTGFSGVENSANMTDIDGLQALHFVSKDTYFQDTYVATYKDRVFMFVGQFVQEEDAEHTIFKDFIKRVSVL